MNAELYRLVAVKSGVELRSASKDQIRELIDLGVPEDAIDFYREAEPASCAEIEDIRLWPISDVLEENTKFVPGCYVRPHGYIVFATTIFGDTYCFDLNSAPSTATAPIALLSHEIFDETTTKEQVSPVAKRIAPDLAAFLRAFVTGDLDMNPIYG